jgi:ABC-type Fe3+ transport system substrate-binding protein
MNYSNRGARKIHGALAAAMAIAVLSLSHMALAETAHTPELDKLIAAAQAEKRLDVVWGPALAAHVGAKAIEAAINKAYGTSIEVNYTPGPSMPQMATRTIEEVKAGRVPTSDIFLGIEVSFVEMLRQDILMPVRWQDYFPAITPAEMPSEGRTLVITTLFNGILYNANLIKPADVPHQIADVFKPKFKGKIASTPYAVGFDRLALANGFDNVKAIVEKTAEWSGGLMRCGENDRISTGEFLMLFLNCGSRIPDNLKAENGGPLGSAELDDALATSMTYFGIPKNSAHPNLAKLFAGFIATKEGQDVIIKVASESSHLVPGTPAYEKAQGYLKKGDKLLAFGPEDILPRAKELDEYKNTFTKMLLK